MHVCCLCATVLQRAACALNHVELTAGRKQTLVNAATAAAEGRLCHNKRAMLLLLELQLPDVYCCYPYVPHLHNKSSAYSSCAAGSNRRFVLLLHVTVLLLKLCQHPMHIYCVLLCARLCAIVCCSIMLHIVNDTSTLTQLSLFHYTTAHCRWNIFFLCC